MAKHNRIVSSIIIIMLAMPLIMAFAWGMGKRPPEGKAKQKEAKQQRTTGITRKAQLAGMEGKTWNKADLLQTNMTSWETATLEKYEKITQEVNPGAKVLFYLVDEKDVRVGLDSSFAVVAESRYYGQLWDEDRKEPDTLSGLNFIPWRGVHFIHGSLYVLDTMKRVAWRKEFDCGQEPMWRQNLLINQFGDRHFIVDVPDSCMTESEGNNVCILFDYKGKELKRFDANNIPKLTPQGKYLVLSKYDVLQKRDKDIIYNLFGNDSVVVYGANAGIRDYDDKIVIRKYGKPTQYIDYDQIKGQIIDLR